MSNVAFHGVTKRFGKIEALRSLDLEIAAGEFVSLLGPSGSGKSTSLNLLAGLLEADEGDIYIGERRVNDVSPDRRDIAMVFQNYALYPHMTVFENLAFPLRARGRKIREAEIVSRVERIGVTLGLQALLGRYPKELSGGQQQRVALGRAMIREPKVFLLDEPLSNLDARLRIRMRRDIKALHAEIGSTIVYVTHDQAEAMTLSSRIAVFSDGRLQQFATPATIYNRPANTFVANFVGDREMTMIPGRIDRRQDRLVLATEDIELDITARWSDSAAVPNEIVLGVRAEGIRPVAAGTPGSFPAVVTMTELAGPDLIVYARLSPTHEVCCRTAPELRIAAGDPIHLEFIPGHLHLFDAQSGLAIPPIA